MKNILGLLSVVLLAGAWPAASAQESPDLVTAAKAFVDQLSSGDFDAAVKTFDPTMKSLSPAGKLKHAWNIWTTRFGPFKAQTAVRYEKSPPYVFVFVTCQFQNESMDMKIVYNAGKEIVGMGLFPTYKRPAYAHPESFVEKEVRVGSGEWVLPGTLTVPVGAGPFPAVVLVHGSGVNDRDESAGGPNRPFRDLAWGLASQGIAALRYDKRSKVYPDKLASMTGATVKDESIDDAVAAVALLIETPCIDPKRIFVVGHSLGGRLAPRIAAQDDHVAGLVILAGSTLPLEQIFVEQLKYIISLGGPDVEATKATLAKVNEQLETLKDPKLPETAWVIGAHPAYWRDLDGYNPGAVARSLKIPMLVLQGERDYKVTLEDLAVWRKYLSDRPGVEFKTYPKLNHIFEEGEGKDTPQAYLMGGNVAPYVVDDIARWIKGVR